MIRKEGKGRWVYYCRDCDRVTKPLPDMFRAIEAQQAHERSLAHAFAPVNEAMSTFANSFMELGREVTRSIVAMGEVSATMPQLNIPHDPTLLSDRRKWGGK